MPPILLVGKPGTGKTRFCNRLAELLGTPSSVINMAGMSDVKFLKGSTRGWASARPSRIVEKLMQDKVANPIFILDEIDKVSHHSYNGDPSAALLDLLEPKNASRYHDLFLLTECDLSACMYIATSNSLDTMPEPLLSRFKLMTFPAPDAGHTKNIVVNVLLDIEKKWGLPKGTLSLDEYLYPNIATRAAHLLYFMIKNHPLADGNKRSAAFLFIWYLNLNKDFLARPVKDLINDNALATVALFVAQSKPEDKELMINLVQSLIILK